MGHCYCARQANSYDLVHHIFTCSVVPELQNSKYRIDRQAFFIEPFTRYATPSNTIQRPGVPSERIGLDTEPLQNGDK
jgi:hypothetical protein